MNATQNNPARIDTVLSILVLVSAIGFAAYGALASVIAPLVA
ncbi:MAG: hypothetical protein ABSF50_05670 [Burkholderiaceae bacterium]|jgi:hypothetical protein